MVVRAAGPKPSSPKDLRVLTSDSGGQKTKGTYRSVLGRKPFPPKRGLRGRHPLLPPCNNGNQDLTLEASFAVG